jgi:hypothetical protein
MRAAYFIRLTLVVGAAACVVVGVKRICETVAYHVSYDPYWLLILALPFVPIILIAPRSATPQKRGLFCFIGLVEAVVIASDFFLVWR